MKFRGLEVVTVEPKPEVGQVWLTTRGSLIKVTGFWNGDLTKVFCESEDGSRFVMGSSWFDGVSYKFVGVVREEVEHV